jgi:hypothetical protein
MNIKRKRAMVATTAKAFGNLNFCFKTNFTGLPTNARTEAMAM